MQAAPLNNFATGVAQNKTGSGPGGGDMPRWYNSMLQTAKNQYANTAGGPSAGNWFANYYGGYKGDTPVLPGLLSVAADGLANGDYGQKYNLDPQTMGNLAQQYTNQFAQNGFDSGRGMGNFQNGFNRFLKNNALGMPNPFSNSSGA